MSTEFRNWIKYYFRCRWIRASKKLRLRVKSFYLCFITNLPKTVPLHSSSTIHLPHTPHCCTTTGSFITKICLNCPVSFFSIHEQCDGLNSWSVVSLSCSLRIFSESYSIPYLDVKCSRSQISFPAEYKSSLSHLLHRTHYKRSCFQWTLQFIVSHFTSVNIAIKWALYNNNLPLMLKWLKPHFCTAHLSAMDGCCGLL